MKNSKKQPANKQKNIDNSLGSSNLVDEIIQGTATSNLQEQSTGQKGGSKPGLNHRTQGNNVPKINISSSSLEEIDPELVTDFLVESKEHIENIEMNLLALETDPTNQELINSLFRSFHTVKGLAGFVNQNLFREIAHCTETQLEKCRRGEIKVSKAFIDIILASSDFLKRICDDFSLNQEPQFLNEIAIHLQKINQDLGLINNENELVDKTGIPEYQAIKVEKIGEILVNQGLNAKVVEELVNKQDQYPGLRLGQMAVKEKKTEPQKVIQSLRIQEKATNIVSDGGYAGYTRVPTIKIENLVDMLGELLIHQSLIEREAMKRFDSNDTFISNLFRMERITKDMQNLSMSLRMITLRSTFQKVNRIGRDAIAELGKNITLEFIGEDTEIDRSIIEKLLDPLLHLMKNAIAHGIESESERIAQNKPAQGLVKIYAYSKRGTVYIEVSDDGNGLNVEGIRQKAIEKGLAEPVKAYSNEEITQFIFLPGFSTAETVNNVSGRGVGLDVVKTEISKIGGKVEIDNQPGIGCRFTLKIPINLAAINGTIVEIFGNHYIIPTHYIKQILKSDDYQWLSFQGKQSMIRVKESIIPVIPIEKLFGEQVHSEGNNGLVVVLELEQKLKAIPVQSIVERREIVVKSLSSEFNQLDYLAGASILGDGKVSLIFDVENLFKID